MTDWSEYHREKTDVDRVVSAVYHQTAGPQPDRVVESTLLTVLSGHGNMDAEEVRAALDAAVDEGRVEYTQGRYWLAADESRPGPQISTETDV